MVPNGDCGLFHLLLIVLKLCRKCLTSDKYSSTTCDSSCCSWIVYLHGPKQLLFLAMSDAENIHSY